MIGVPESDADLFRDWVYRNFQLAPRDNAIRAAVTTEMNEYFQALLDARRDDPRDDLVTLVGQYDVPDELQRGYLLLLILAGIDTTWSAIGSGLWHLGTQPADRDRLVGLADDDDRGPPPPRRCCATTRRSPWDGGSWPTARSPAARCTPASRCSCRSPRPTTIRRRSSGPTSSSIDRQINRHVAFGLGIHRCIGSNLARLELRVALQEWIRAFPTTASTTRETTWSNGQVRGPRNIPVALR